jgi:hypothetical protein
MIKKRTAYLDELPPPSCVDKERKKEGREEINKQTNKQL